jgi:hypothetical protein
LRLDLFKGVQGYSNHDKKGSSTEQIAISELTSQGHITDDKIRHIGYKSKKIEPDRVSLFRIYVRYSVVFCPGLIPGIKRHIFSDYRHIRRIEPDSRIEKQKNMINPA